MDSFDLVVAVIAALAAIGGYRLGFFTRVLSWVGLAVGLLVVVRFLGRILTALDLPSAGARLLVAAAVLIGGALIGQAVGVVVGSRLHRVLPFGPLRAVDRVLGAAVGVLGVGVALWLLLPSVSSVAGWPARVTRESSIARWVTADLPPPPDPLEKVRSLVGTGGFPQVFNALRPGEVVGPPPADDPIGAAVTRRAAASTVEVEGEACNRVQEGSGFAVAPGLVLTNAHVVAGEARGATDVLLPSGRQRPARVVLFDPDRDVALLRVNGLGEPPLPLGTGRVGLAGAVLGHPGGQRDLQVQPATVAREITAVGEDLYGRHTTSRDVYVLAANLAPGDSGAPLVGPGGRVVGVAFAIALDRKGTAYALTTREISADLGAPRHGGAVPTRSCVAG
ncbi:MAG TPA: MarP family serine protease [Acidimicrobiales bacterium]|nr:MarP family serine protease [Acidimicrobiales bacterium]